MTKNYVYYCHQHGAFTKTVDPAEHRVLFGTYVECPKCYEVATFLKELDVGKGLQQGRDI